jgi:hypothetical protein
MFHVEQNRHLDAKDLPPLTWSGTPSRPFHGHVCSAGDHGMLNRNRTAVAGELAALEKSQEHESE